MEEILNEISVVAESDQTKHDAFKILQKLLTNILKNPTEKKFRVVKTSNATIKAKLLLNGSRAGDAFVKILRLSGFTETAEGFELPEEADLDVVAENNDIIAAIIETFPEEVKAAPSTGPTGAGQPAAAPAGAAAATTVTADGRIQRSLVPPPSAPPLPQNSSNRSLAQSATSAQSDGAASRGAASASSGVCGKGGKSAFDFKKRDDHSAKQDQGQEDLKAIREAQRERYLNGGGGIDQYPSDEGKRNANGYTRLTDGSGGGAPRPPSGGGGGGGGGIGGFFNNLFGGGGGSGSSGSSRRPPIREQPPRRSNIKGMSDLPQPARRG
uniref:PUB domain-containing protein n=1 Tax=Chromera velia CCMP2878 TaxID=1169474 RepID=A0A0G4F7A6_9ALVE|mmetsp:Transcript_8271/g.16101  ORF Transcript_8271/g.16101 Transcript_8271/m.16101 type:complete len:326 (-) Transcript_8271:689-1666(-)|eukprot:Cvel_15491.t1-p1 / transcript=Cvel_15491.t1 / gene=Cvel_15491 / organism=Chromera_velia_CCMP2878 / gene_product=hypothetical protein / transcript_product=hypothetical protein / location=Cvel_scaffold1149:33375-36950(-) / protein_length=325 / sequence_SO=supercontig / SO=protein_coding / is_pseudo=false